MARFTIIVLLVCVGILGYLYYDQVTDHSISADLHSKIQALEKENEQLKIQKPKTILRPPIEPPLAPQPAIHFPKLEIRKAEPLINR